MLQIDGFEIEGDEVIGAGGFLALRRVRLRNRRRDGSLSEAYVCDFAVRPHGMDAVVVALFSRAGGRVRVLLRDGLRPALSLGRPALHTPVPEAAPSLFLTELVAGIIEASDRGVDGIKQRAALEAHEEAGYRIDPGRVLMLGATYPTPGAMPEKFWLVAAEIEDPDAQEALAGDGSPMEEGATTRWVELDEAIAACVRGEVVDMKTELTLRRLGDALAAQEP